VSDVDHDLTVIDEFCGAGGASQGLREAGFSPVLAINHWDRAIETHSANFPGVEHWCEDTSKLDMRRLPHARVLWASPICTEVSPAGGRKRRRKQAPGQLELREHGHVPKAGLIRTRTTFYDVLRSVEVRRFDAVLIENVVEVAADWELFDWWVEAMKRLGYNVQFVSVSSAHVGDGVNPHAPQWRDRLYLVFTRLGIPLPDVEPRPLAWCGTCGADTHALQSWKRPGRKIGKYNQQYVYVCERTA
jgi:DNA (cytosine-5)-methyltransferase 1